jgi:hypothetical protein
MMRQYVEALQKDSLKSRSCNCGHGLFSTFHCHCGFAADRCFNRREDVQPYVTVFGLLYGLPTISTDVLERQYLAVIIE